MTAARRHIFTRTNISQTQVCVCAHTHTCARVTCMGVLARVLACVCVSVCVITGDLLRCFDSNNYQLVLSRHNMAGLKAQTHHSNVREPATTQAGCCIATRRLCLGQKVNGQLARTFSACVRLNNPPCIHLSKGENLGLRLNKNN